MSFHAKITLALFLCLYPFFGYAQAQKQRCGSVACDSFRVFTEDKKLKLPSLLRSKDSLHFRYYTYRHVVDIWSKDGISFIGTVTSFTRTYPEYDRSVNENRHHRKRSRYLFLQEIIDSAIARRVYNLSVKCQAIPTCDSIKGWQSGEDGETYIFKIATPSCICQKNYWSPDAQKETLLAAKVVDDFVKEVEIILELQKRFERFTRQLKPGTYHNGLSVMMVRW